MNIFFEIHKNLPREGPGSSQCTQKAYSYFNELSPEPDILDIGCGPGAQTVELARLTDGRIVALDNHVPFLEQLNHRVKKEDVENKIRIIEGSMLDMPFDEEAFDVIWSEGPAKDYPIAPVEVIGGEASIDNHKQSGHRQTYVIHAETEAQIVNNTQYFPGWRVYIDGEKAPIEFQDNNWKGKITYRVSPGIHDIVVVFERMSHKF